MSGGRTQPSFEQSFEHVSEQLSAALWRYRLEIGLCGFVVALFLLAVSVAAGLVIVVAGALVGVLVARPTRGFLSRVLARARAARRFESRVCQQLGWVRHGRMPELVSWEEKGGRVIVELVPLPEQGAQAWPEMTDALRRFLRGSTASWRESHGLLSITVSTAALPSRITWRSGESSPGRIVLGARQSGGSLALDVTRSPHMLIAGATNSGKGGTIRAALAGTLEVGWQAVVCNPKQSGEFRWVQEYGVPVPHTVESICSVLEAVEAVRDRRQVVVNEHGCDHWLQLPRSQRPGWRYVLMVMDEAADVLVAVKGRSDAEKRYMETQQRAARLLLDLSRKGRSAGVHAVVAIQRPDVAQLGDYGGPLRNNLIARLALGRLDSDGVRMLGMSSSDPTIQALDGTPGRGVCVNFDDDPRPSVCQVAWLEQAEAVRAVKRPAAQGLEVLEPRLA